jgi:rRNA maturation endonuclease Nob1
VLSCIMCYKVKIPFDNCSNTMCPYCGSYMEK